MVYIYQNEKLRALEEQIETLNNDNAILAEQVMVMER